MDQATLLRGRQIVEMLREKLAMAERGEILGIVIAYELIDDKIGHEWAARSGVNAQALVGELHLAMLTIHVEDGRLKVP